MQSVSKIAKMSLALIVSCGIGSTFAVDACKDQMSKSAGSCLSRFHGNCR